MAKSTRNTLACKADRAEDPLNSSSNIFTGSSPPSGGRRSSRLGSSTYSPAYRPCADVAIGLSARTPHKRWQHTCLRQRHK
jgi:hypothetical protein